MYKKIICICVIIFAIIVTYYFGNRYNNEKIINNDLSNINENMKERDLNWLNIVSVTDKEAQIDMSKITMIIKEGTLTPKGATIIIIDNNEKHAIYGEYFLLEQMKDNNWVEVNKIDSENGYRFHEIALLVGDDNKLEMKMDWENLYGTLEKGHYRIVKKIFDKRRV